MLIWWLLSGLVTGILAADLFRSLTLGWLGLILGIFCWLFSKNKKLAVFLLFFALGVYITFLRFTWLPDPANFYGEEIQITVSSRKLIQRGENYSGWQGKVVAPQSLSGTIVLVYTEEYCPGIYTLSGRLYPPIQYRNPGQGWHYKRKLYSGEIGIMNSPRVMEYRQIQPGILDNLRASYRENIANNLRNEESAALALAITAGDRSLLSRELRDSVYLTGVGHIMALSGLHVSILAALSLAVFRKIGLRRGFANVLTGGLLLTYLVFVGPSPSLVRAVLMSGYGIAAALAGRERQGMPALLWTCFFMLLFNPFWLFDYAFVYSFLATFICLVAGNRFERHLSFLPEAMKRAASVTLIIQITALPLNLYLFGYVSWWAPLANLVIIPLMPLLAGLSLAVGLIPGAAGALAAAPAAFLLNGVVKFLKLLQEQPLSFELGGLPLALLGAVSGSLLLYLSGVAKKTAVIILVVSLLFVQVADLCQRQLCLLWFLDVGQGEAILICCEGQWILVDCGEAAAGARAVVPALKHLGVDRLAAVIITHPHSDHAGGLEAVCQNFPVDKVLVNSCFLKSEWANPSLAVQVVRGEMRVFDWLRVYAHDGELGNLNDNSLLISLRFNQIGVLLTGDIEQAGESLFLAKIRPHDILKVAHHGSKTSTSEEFIKRVQPGAAVISCGLGNPFGLPGAPVLSTLEDTGVQVYRTDLSGCITLIIGPGQGYTIFSFIGR